MDTDNRNRKFYRNPSPPLTNANYYNVSANDDLYIVYQQIITIIQHLLKYIQTEKIDLDEGVEIIDNDDTYNNDSNGNNNSNTNKRNDDNKGSMNDSEGNTINTNKKNIEKTSKKKQYDSDNYDIIEDNPVQKLLCILWDLTCQEEYSKLLVNNVEKSINIILKIITTTKLERTQELCFGIIGNITCFASCNPKIYENEYIFIVLFICLNSSTDPDLLLTVCRVYKHLLLSVCTLDYVEIYNQSQKTEQELEAYHQCIRFHKHFFYCIYQYQVFAQLFFILENSLHQKLLNSVLEIISIMYSTPVLKELLFFSVYSISSMTEKFYLKDENIEEDKVVDDDEEEEEVEERDEEDENNIYINENPNKYNNRENHNNMNTNINSNINTKNNTDEKSSNKINKNNVNVTNQSQDISINKSKENNIENCNIKEKKKENDTIENESEKTNNTDTKTKDNNDININITNDKNSHDIDYDSNSNDSDDDDNDDDDDDDSEIDTDTGKKKDNESKLDTNKNAKTKPRVMKYQPDYETDKTIPYNDYCKMHVKQVLLYIKGNFDYLNKRDSRGSSVRDKKINNQVIFNVLDSELKTIYSLLRITWIIIKNNFFTGLDHQIQSSVIMSILKWACNQETTDWNDNKKSNFDSDEEEENDLLAKSLSIIFRIVEIYMYNNDTSSMADEQVCNVFSEYKNITYHLLKHSLPKVTGWKIINKLLWKIIIQSKSNKLNEEFKKNQHNGQILINILQKKNNFEKERILEKQKKQQNEKKINEKTKGKNNESTQSTKSLLQRSDDCSDATDNQNKSNVKLNTITNANRSNDNNDKRSATTTVLNGSITTTTTTTATTTAIATSTATSTETATAAATSTATATSATTTLNDLTTDSATTISIPSTSGTDNTIVTTATTTSKLQDSSLATTTTAATTTPINKKKKSTYSGTKRNRKQEKESEDNQDEDKFPKSNANLNEQAQTNQEYKKRKILMKDDMSLPISIISKNTKFFLKGIEEEDIEEYGCTKNRDIDKRLGILMNFIINENLEENSFPNQKQLTELFVPENNSYQKVIFMKQLILETCYMLLIVAEPLCIGNNEHCKPIYNLISRLWMLDGNNS